MPIALPEAVQLPEFTVAVEQCHVHRAAQPPVRRPPPGTGLGGLLWRGMTAELPGEPCCFHGTGLAHFIAPTARRGSNAAGPRTPSWRWSQRSAHPIATSQWRGPRNAEAGTAASRLATEGPGPRSRLRSAGRSPTAASGSGTSPGRSSNGPRWSAALPSGGIANAQRPVMLGT